MEHIFGLFFRSVFVDNMIFAFFLGFCSYLTYSKSIKTALQLGLTVTLVLLITLPVNYLLSTYFLTANNSFGIDLTFLSFIFFIVVIVAFIKLLEWILDLFDVSACRYLKKYTPLLTVNCVIMGASLLMLQRINKLPSDPQAITSISDAFVYALGSGIGWTVSIVGLSAIREKMIYSDVPAPLRGLGITFITVALMAMAFVCFSGMA